MSGVQRHTEPVDVHLILRQETADGPQILLSRRAGQVYAAGLWHLPSGHLDGPHEDAVTALVREAREETGLIIDPADVRFAVTVHHRAPSGGARIGMFFEVRVWQGTPRILEPAVCDAMDWFPFDALPAPMVAYCRAGLDAYRSGQLMAVHFQGPGDPIPYLPEADRYRPVQAVVPGQAGPDAGEHQFTPGPRLIVGSEATRLVVVRGNSASGKSSVAAGIRDRFGRGLAVVGQDNLRRVVLRERDVPDGANIGLIDSVARYALDAGYHVVLEGILYADRYGDMLAGLLGDHRGVSRCYYLDIPIEETLTRHASKADRDDLTRVSERELRAWYHERDVLPGGVETVVGTDSALNDTVERIMRDTGLAGLPS